MPGLLCGSAGAAADPAKAVAPRPGGRPRNEKGAAPMVDPAARSDRPVTAEEKINFEQDKAHAHMRELEGRMFRVAELLRQTQPDDSARLLMGVTRSREQLIVEEMREASDLISHARPQQGDRRRKRARRQARGAQAAAADQRSRPGAQARAVAKAREAQESLMKLDGPRTAAARTDAAIGTAQLKNSERQLWPASRTASIAISARARTSNN